MTRARTTTAATAALAILFCGALASDAKAYNWGGGCYGTGYGFAIGAVPAPPYFALHPPVYYSHVTPRAYGQSPYAYPGYAAAPVVVRAPRAAIVINPYVQGARTEVASQDRSRIEPQLVINPYVVETPSRLAASKR